MTTFIQENIIIFLGLLSIAVVFLFVFCVVLLVKIRRERKRYDLFMGTNRRPSHNLEMKIQEYFETSKAIDEKYTKLLDMVTDMDQTMKSNVQKVGLIRYNPFEEMGGNLCFALALLDGEDNGVVLNGIHSITGSFTYAKPIEMGVSIYMLSEEEKQAVKMAQEQAYQPQHEKVVKVKFKPLFKRRYAVMEEQLALDEVVAEAKEKMPSIGDVTMAEKAQIEAEEVAAGKIAAAEDMLPKEAVETLTQSPEEIMAEIKEETLFFFESPVEEISEKEETDRENV